MKRILIIVLSLLVLTGCYDYVELNELSIITMITIDKSDNKYNISFEILNDEKENEDKSKMKSTIVTGSGNSIAQAIANTTKSTPKRSYFGHLKVLAISKEVARDDLKEIIDYFLRSPSIRNEFYLVITEKNSSLLLANRQLVVSDVISSMLKENKYNHNITSNNIFEDILIDIFEKGKDATIPVIDNNEDEIVISGTALLSDLKMTKILSPKDSSILNILINDSSNNLFTYKCPNNNGNISLSIFDSQNNIQIEKNNVIIEHTPIT